jgi:hypothetical protein
MADHHSSSDAVADRNMFDCTRIFSILMGFALTLVEWHLKSDALSDVRRWSGGTWWLDYDLIAGCTLQTCQSQPALMNFGDQCGLSCVSDE